MFSDSIIGNEDTSPNKMNSNFVIQFMAQPVTGAGAAWDAKSILRDGVNTQTQGYKNPNSKCLNYITI